ncbi:thioredoxin TrxC [Leeia sp. TBRC 13508]|uniref:Thioredoxin n=1 Tax=Leeia speluncae TaxID=2884804 RepID=A0ABS8D6Q7_9NEIS|nr:thioredoxin TrxC [Leeia speluncae]MCB6183837.1 thioredoxin TrxC [Leeia speluncae]
MSLHIVCSHCFATNRLPAERLSDAPNCGRCHQPVLTDAPIDLTTSQFDAFVNNNQLPVVVDFWADWCGPCKMMAPGFAETAAKLKTRFRLAKVNTETEQMLGARFQIRSIPTLIVFKIGKEVARHSGAMSAMQLQQWLASHT